MKPHTSDIQRAEQRRNIPANVLEAARAANTAAATLANITLPRQLDALGLVYSMQPGAVYRATWERPAKTRKGKPSLRKRVSACVRVGINHDAQAAVKDKRASGQAPATNQGLAYGRFLDGDNGNGRVIEHKGMLYLRCYPSRMPNHKSESVFIGDDGTEYTREQVAETLLASEAPRDSDCFNLRLDRLTKPLELA